MKRTSPEPRIRRNNGRSDENVYDKFLSALDGVLSVRTVNCLEKRKIFTVGDLLKCSREELLELSNFGERAIEECESALASIGIKKRWKKTG